MLITARSSPRAGAPFGPHCEPLSASDASAPSAALPWVIDSLRRGLHLTTGSPGRRDEYHSVPAPRGSQREDRSGEQMTTRQTVNEIPKDGQSCRSTEVKPALSPQESGDARPRRPTMPLPLQGVHSPTQEPGKGLPCTAKGACDVIRLRILQWARSRLPR